MKKLTILIFALLLQACGTLLNKTETPVRLHLTDDKHDFQIFINGKEVDSSQRIFMISNKIENNFISIKSDKYQDVNIYLSREINSPILVVDVLLLIIPAIIDLNTGGAYKIEPSEIRVILQEKGKA